MLVFLPLTSAELDALASGTPATDVPGFAVTPGFLSEFGLTAADDEDAERTCLYVAGLAALLHGGRRIVAVAETPCRETGEPFGAVRCASVAFTHVTSLFADAPEDRDRVDEVGRAVAGLGLDAAWEHPSHETLLAEVDLLWFGPEEVAVVLAETPR